MAGTLAPYVDGIPVVADAAARETRFPVASRTNNQRVHRLDTGNIERWDGAAWVTAVEYVTPPGDGRTVSTVTSYLDHNAVFNVKDFGATGDGTTSDSAAFADAHAAALAVGGEVYVPAGVYALSVGLTFGVGLRMERGATLSPAAGVTIVIGKAFSAPAEAHVFNCDDGTTYGTVNFGTVSPGVPEVYPEWWGAKADNATDCTNAIKAALATVVNVVQLLRGYYKLSSTVTIPTQKVLRGVGQAQTQITATAALNGSTVIRIGGGAGLEAVYVNGTGTSSVVGVGVADDLTLINLGYCRDVRVSGCTGGAGKGISLGKAVSFRFDNCYVSGNDYNLWVESAINTPTDTLFVNCQFYGATHKGAYIKTGYSLVFLKCDFEASAEEGCYLTNTVSCELDPITFIDCWFENNWTSLTGAPRLAQYEFWSNGGSATARIRPVLKDCVFGSGAVVGSVRLTNAYDFVVDHCSFVNANCILVEGISFGAFPNWRQVAGQGSYYTGNYVTDTSTGMVTPSRQQGTAAPTSRTYKVGDTVWNSTPGVGKPIGWACTTAGAPGTWSAFGIVPGVSSDRGDASVTLTAGTDAPTQRFATTLTANRTVTLSTTGAYNGAKFRVVRTGLGAFTLDVGGLKTIPSATAAFVDVMYDGTAWRLTGYGTL